MDGLVSAVVEVQSERDLNMIIFPQNRSSYLQFTDRYEIHLLISPEKYPEDAAECALISCFRIMRMFTVYCIFILCLLDTFLYIFICHFFYLSASQIKLSKKDVFHLCLHLCNEQMLLSTFMVTEIISD